MFRGRKIIILFSILAIGAFFRFYKIVETPPGLYPDEAVNGNNALEALATGEFKIFYQENNGREGLFINLQAISLAAFGNEPWALRIISALFGTLTILGVYLLTKELFQQQVSININQYQPVSDTNRYSLSDTYRYSLLWAPLLSSFFLAASFWHVNFSRIGFRAIMAPFFAAFGMYFLLKGLRRGKPLDMVWAGIFIGLGFYSYIAFRFMPFVLAVPIGWYLWQWYKEVQISKLKVKNENLKLKIGRFCIPCAIILFLFITFVAALPIGLYFFQNPQDFLGRASDVSIFSAAFPAKEFLKSTVLTVGMLFVWGDCNWRHNYNCYPELHPIVTAFFLIGVISAIKESLSSKSEILNPKQIQNPNVPNSKPFGILNFKNWNLFGVSNLEFRISHAILLAWLLFMSLPATLTRESLPHALRSIGMIPPVMILAGYGAYISLVSILQWIETKKERWPEFASQLLRLQKEVAILFIVVLLIIPVTTYSSYFIRWANHPNTYFAFSTDMFHLGQHLNGIPTAIKKYVIVNLPGVDVRGIPMSAQTVMFATDTFRLETREVKNITYLTPERLAVLPKSFAHGKKVLITLLDGTDRKLIRTLLEAFPTFRMQAPSDFVIFQNY